LDYSYNEGDIYCYDIPRNTDKGWVNLIDDMDGTRWGYIVTDTSGKEVFDYEVDKINVKDDDTEGPQFSSWDYSTWVQFNQPIYVGVTITDESGIESAKLYYDYNNDGVAEGAVEAYDVSYGRYLYQIPEPCPGLTKEQCRELGRADIYMGFWIIAKDADNDRPGDSIQIRANSIPIFVDPPGEEVELEEHHSPYIRGYMPGLSQIEIIEGRVARFIVYAEDPDDDDITYDWQLDGATVSIDSQYVYAPGHDDSGTYNLVVYISDGENTVSQEWTINVIDKICDWEMDDEEDENPSNGNNVVNGGGSSGGGSSGGGFSGGGVTLKTTTTTTQETTTTVLDSQKQDSIKINKKDETLTDEKTQENEKLPITGKASTSLSLGYTLASFFTTTLLGLGGLKLFAAKKKKKPKKGKRK
jgi:uncharacterized membrane protein YgcG